MKDEDKTREQLIDELMLMRNRLITLEDLENERNRAVEALRESEENAIRLAHENAIMAEIGRIISSTLNIDEIYEGFSQEVKKIIPFDRIVINTIDEDAGTVRNVYIAGEELYDRNVRDVYPLEGSGSAEMVRTGSTLLIQTEDFSEYKDHFPMLVSTFEAGFRSIMNVPLFAKGKIVGGLLLRSRKPRTYTDREVKLAERIRSQIAGAVANAQLYSERIEAENKRAAMEEQLWQAQKLEALGRMAGAIAHHFNNKLMAVMGNLELALDDIGPDNPAVAMLEESQSAAREAAEVSNLMLAYLGQTPVSLAPMNVVETCRMAIEGEAQLVPKSITLETEIDYDNLTIKGNHAKIAKILANLLANAREAIGDNKGTIRVSVRVVPAAETAGPHRFPVDWEPGADPYVCMEVADTGCGIPADQLDLIFDPFFTTKFTGRGLGLAVVQGTLRLFRGAIAVESAPGRGSTFRVFWPLEEKAVAAVPKAEPAISRPMKALGLVLVVDDDPQLRNMAQAMLRRLGGDALIARDGFEAVDIFRKRVDEIQLVLLDLTMPGMDGWQTLAELRALRLEIPVILASGYEEAQAMAGGHTELPQAFLHKPYSMEDLQSAIGKALGTPTRWEHEPRE